jgi:amidophosphoribosyltransferase
MRDFLLETHFCQFNTGSDSEVLLNLFAFELSQINFDTLSNEHVFKALKKVYARCEGGFAVTMIVGGVGLVAFRDSNGIRPLVLGKNGEGSRMVASESSALSALGYSFERDIAPGEAVIISEAGSLDFCVCSSSVNHTPCLFEFVYFSRPDSVIDSISVHKSRLRMGDYLGEKILKEFSHLEIDAVIPVPDTSRTSAMQVAHKLGIKYREGFIKNRYIGRTFIMPGQSIRKRSVAHKLSPIEIEFKNKSVLLVDDSIVRGNTSKKIVEMVRNNGAKNVYFASAAPPVRHQNVYGIDMPATKELVAYGRNIEEIKDFIGADELIYQDIEALRMAAHVGNTKITQFEDSVFTGEYCAGKISKDYLEKLETSRVNKK